MFFNFEIKPNKYQNFLWDLSLSSAKGISAIYSKLAVFQLQILGKSLWVSSQMF
jgi:hypothetical protein